MSAKITARIEGEVTYTDGTSAAFGASIDDDGTLNKDGVATAMGDIISVVKGLFTALGGTLTCSPATSGKTVKDKTALFNVEYTLDGTSPVSFFSEYTVKTGTLIGPGGNAAGTNIITATKANYATAITNFKTQLQQMVAKIAGVSCTIV